ncbi:protein NLRC5-like [Trichomycterus rosablanca]|uniref:protein NLRC5-like n=1 Tax=Trichomycterus rosablanca TaxID=2290929 RepID=UPI002F35EEA7
MNDFCRLSDCGVREEGYAALAEALRSNPSSELMELDLRGNDPGDSGVKPLYELLEDPDCKLKTLRLLKTKDAEKALKSLSDKLHVNPLLQSELDLSQKIKGDSGMMLFSALLEDPHFRPKKLTLCGCSLTEKSCTTLVSALSRNPSHLTGLDLSENPIGNSGVKKLFPLLHKHQYKLKQLKLSDCEISDEGYAALAGALMLNTSSHLTDLDLSGNNPGTKGMKMFDDLLNKPNSKLDVRFLSRSPEMDAACDYLNKMDIKMLELSEVDLSGRRYIGDSGVKHLSTVLKDLHCMITKLTLSDCDVGDEGYAALAEALRLNRSYMKELDLSGNHPGESGVQKICDVCKSGWFNWSEIKLRLFKSPDAEEAYTTLSKSLGINILLQKKLHLSSKSLKEIKVNQLSALLEDPHCTIQNLTLCGCSLTENDCTTLVSALSINPSHLTDLDLSENPIGNSGVKKLVPLLQNHQYKLKQLKLRDCEISDEGYVALAGALMLNPSSPLTDLDLSGNNPGTKGMKMFNDLLKKPNSKLRVRFLRRSSEMDAACDYLNKMDIKMLELSEVDLSRRNIGDAGVKHVFGDSEVKYLFGDSGVKHVCGDSGVKHLSTVLKDPHCMITKLTLRNCSITDKSCTDLESALDVNPSHLKDLDLSNNQLGDSGVIQISHLLKNLQFKLHKLTLSDCGVREEGYSALAEALRSNPSSELMELDLRGNHPGDSGVKLLDDLLQDPNCKLKTLRFLKSPEAEEVYSSLYSTLGQNPLILTQMKLERNPGGVSGDSRVKLLSAFLQDSHCKLQKLQINGDDLTMESCSALSEVLRSGSSSLRELDLSNNNLQNSGVQKLCEGLKKNECKLEVLRLSDCGVGDEGYAALAEVLRSNRSYMKELDLRGNHPGESGVQNICTVCSAGWFNWSEIKLRLFKSPDAEEAYTTLNQILDINILLQKKLHLSSKTLKEIKVNQLSALLEDPHCTIQNLTLSDCKISDEGYVSLAGALMLNPSSPLTDLDLSGNNPGTEGMKMFNNLLKKPKSKLRVRFLRRSSEMDAACDYLNKKDIKMLELSEVDLSGRRNIGDSGVKHVSTVLKDPHCMITKLTLRNCSITDKSCTDLKSALDVNPSHLKDLDLSYNQLGDSGVIQISHLLKNPQFKLHKLTLSDCGVREEGYAALAEALRSNPSSELMELDLRGNHPGDSGVKPLDDLLQDPNCKLKTLRFLKSPEAEEVYTSLYSTLGQNLLILTQMKLERNPGGVSGDSRVKLLSAFLQDSHCKLQKLQINDDDLTMESCSALSEVLRSGSFSLRELDLSNNNLQNSGVQKLCEGLKKKECKLEVLRLSDCGVGDEGYAALAEALKSNRSYMKELDLRGNHPGESGVQKICSACELEWHKFLTLQSGNRNKIKLRLFKSPDAEEAYTTLSQILGKNILLQKKLDLSSKSLKEIKVNQLSALLEDPHCTIQNLTLYKEGSITEEDSAGLLSALVLNPAHLRELNLNQNKPGESGVRNLCELVKNPRCKLKKLKLNNCSITEKDCRDLASALHYNPSYLKELDLSQNGLEESVKELFSPLKHCNIINKKARGSKQSGGGQNKPDDQQTPEPDSSSTQEQGNDEETQNTDEEEKSLNSSDDEEDKASEVVETLGTAV